jgi:hypothetical protein
MATRRQEDKPTFLSVAITALTDPVEIPEGEESEYGAMRKLADRGIPDTYDPAADPEGALRFAVLGTALFEPVLLALRKLAHVDRIRAIEKRRSVTE